jgi:hypothetical protein
MADQTYNRVDIATEQLDVAISLLERKNFVSALTLAGVADEILRKMLSHSGKKNCLDCKYLAGKPFRTKLHRMPLSKKDFIRDENSALIAVTRIASTSTPSITLDLEHAAHSMIRRALVNYNLLGLPRTARMLKFRKLHGEYVVGRAEEARQEIQALRDAAEGQTSQTAEWVVIDGQECLVIERHPRTLTEE